MGETVARNKKAYHDFEILEKFDAGIELLGSEVKAIRDKRVSIKDSYVKLIKGEAFLVQSHISNLNTTHAYFQHEELRFRKLLLHKKELLILKKKTEQDGMSIVALSMYFNHKNLVKLQIALARGKKLHDKRHDLKEKSQKRDIERAVKERQ